MKYRIGVAVLVAAMVALVAGAAPVPPQNVLIYGPSLNTGGATDAQTVAEGIGYTVTVYDDTQWNAASPATFASFDAIFIDDDACGSDSVFTDALANNAVWGPTITGNVVIYAFDPGAHAGSHPEGVTLLRNSIIFAASGGGTGLYMSTGCYLNGFSSSFTIAGLGTFDTDGMQEDDIAIVDSGHPVMAGLTEGGLSNWGESVHTRYTSIPAGFDVLAVEQTGTTEPVIVVRAAGVPAMPSWALAVLVMILGGVAFAVLRRRRVQA